MSALKHIIGIVCLICTCLTANDEQRTIEFLRDKIDWTQVTSQATQSEPNTSDIRETLIKHFKTKRIPDAFFSKTTDGLNIEEAYNELAGTFRIQDLLAKQKKNADGTYDWDYQGPNKDQEWAWFFNRHRYLKHWANAWNATQDEQFTDEINRVLQDWIQHNPAPSYMTFSSSWRALEAARRIKEVWIDLFYLDPQFLDDESRILMLKSVYNHGRYLRNHHSFFGNHLITEMSALAVIALAWPEFKESQAWLDYAVKRIFEALENDTYPDGSYKELANHYQRVALLSYQKALETLEAGGQNASAKKIRQRIELMWSYFASVMRPEGHGPLNNDSDLENNRLFIKTPAEYFNRDDWRWLASRGQKGTEPSHDSIQYFPWAGHLMMRSNWSDQSQWGFFDLGPHGSDHQHNDRFHLSISLGHQDYLVDAGRYTYQSGKWREYFKGPLAHNVLLLNDAGTLLPPDTLKEPLTVIHFKENDAVYMEGYAKFDTTDLGRGNAKHSRGVFYQKDAFWIVRDEVIAFGANKLTALWHFHPNCNVSTIDETTRTTFEAKTNLMLVPMSDLKWEVDMIKGADQSPQGWYSFNYNSKEAATCAQYEARIQSPQVIYWLILPHNPGAAEPQFELLREGNETTIHLELPIGTFNIPIESIRSKAVPYAHPPNSEKSN